MWAELLVNINEQPLHAISTRNNPDASSKPSKLVKNVLRLFRFKVASEGEGSLPPPRGVWGENIPSVKLRGHQRYAATARLVLGTTEGGTGLDQNHTCSGCWTSNEICGLESYIFDLN